MEDTNEARSRTAALSTVAAASSIVGANTTNQLNQLNQNQADLSTLRSSQDSNVKKLVDSLKLLATTMKMGFNKKPNGESSIGKSIGGTIKEMVLGKGAGLKGLMTKEGILGGLASVAGGGITSTILSGAAEKIKESKEQEATKKEWKQTFLANTEKGRELTSSVGAEEAGNEADRLYNEKLKLEKEIEELEGKQKRIKAAGVGNADLTNEDKELLAQKKERVSSLTSSPTPALPEAAPIPALPEAAPIPAPTPALPEAAPTPTLPEAAPTPQKMRGGSPEHMQMMRDKKAEQRALRLNSTSVSSTDEPLMKIAKQQLNELKKLVKLNTETQEDRLEAADGQSLNELLPPPTPATPAEGPKSLLDDILNKGKDLLGDRLGRARTAASTARTAMPKVLAKALPFAGKAAAVGAAGYAGYKGGQLLNEYALNPLAEMVTGKEGETVGTALYSGTDKVKGMLGLKTDADKEEEAKKKYIVERHAKDMDAGAVSPYLAKEAEKYGIMTPPEMIKAKVISSEPEKIQLPPEDAAISKEAETKAIAEYAVASDAEKLKIQEVTGITPPPPPLPMPQPITRAQEQTQIMEGSTSEILNKRTELKPIIIQTPSAPPTVSPIISHTNTTIVRPDTRSKEPTFNRILSNNFTFS